MAVSFIDRSRSRVCRWTALVALVATTAGCSRRSPTVLIGSLPYPGEVAIEGPNAYVTSFEPGVPLGASLYEVPLRGGPARRLLRLAGLPITASTVRASTVYFTEAGRGTVSALPVGAAAARTLATGHREPWAIAVDATHVYYTTRGTEGHSDGTIVRVPIAGGPQQVVAPGLRAPTHIALDETSVYASVLGTRAHDYRDGAVVKVPKAGGAALVLAAEQAAVSALAADGASVFWAKAGRGAAAGEVVRVDRSGGAPVVLASRERSPSGIAIGETSVYWTCSDGEIRKADKRGGEITTIALGQQRPKSIAAGSSMVVWANQGKAAGERDAPGALLLLAK